MPSGGNLTAKALSLRQLTKATNLKEVFQAIADAQANQDALEQTVRSLIDIANAGAGVRSPSASGSSSTTIIVPGGGGSAGNYSSKFRLISPIQKTASTTDEQDVFEGGDGMGSRSVPLPFWASGKRLLLWIPITYSIVEGTVLTISLKFGDTVLTSILAYQPDGDFWLVELDVASFIGSVANVKVASRWFSNLNGSPAVLSSAALDTGGMAVNIQVSVAFSVADTTSTVSFQNVDFTAVGVPAAW